ncbi:polysaccharide pyruvyl transferase family protein [Campylobacter jejuni]|nr:polysaccharide pyruvyl transferase family protein [Campylobacter jejuni]
MLDLNLGDYIQTIATRKILEKYGIKKFIYCDRENLINCSKKAFVIMQGWFSHSINFIPNKNICPIYIGAHFNYNMQQFLNKNLFLLKNFEIGCRDFYTLNYLQSKNIKSYFSRCLTLTLPKRIKTQQQNKIFLVNLNEEIIKYLPQDIRKNGICVNQKSIQGNYQTFKDNWLQYQKMADDLLDVYCNEAKLVITTALHCASPCVAMGIPVILICEDSDQINRFSALDGILKIYSLQDLYIDGIDFNPKSVDIELLKEYMFENLVLSIEKAQGGGIDENRLLFIRKEIARSWI